MDIQWCSLGYRVKCFRVAFVAALILTLWATTAPMSDVAATSVNDKLAHFVTFFGLMFLVDFSYLQENLWLKKLMLLFFYGFLIECIQYFIPYRSFSWLDFIADAAGVLGYFLIVPLLKRFPLLSWRWSAAD